MNRWRFRLLRPLARIFVAGTWIAAVVFRVRYARFLILPSVANRAVARGALPRATSVARELLAFDLTPESDPAVTRVRRLLSTPSG